MTGVRLEGIDVRIGAAQLVQDLQIDCPAGSFVGVLGPNGSGKSTALKTVYRAVAPCAGRILLGERDLLRDLTANESARQIAAVAQDTSAAFEFTVLEIVETGLTPHKSAWSATTDTDRELLSEILDIVGMRAHASRLFATLSGGERQRVLLGRALVQRPRVLVLDEPTNHLDISTQLALLELVRSLGVTVLAALHDLNLAAAYCDQLFLLSEGRVVCAGTPHEVLTPERIAAVFGVQASCGENPLTGRLHLTFDQLHPDDLPESNVETGEGFVPVLTPAATDNSEGNYDAPFHRPFSGLDHRNTAHAHYRGNSLR